MQAAALAVSVTLAQGAQARAWSLNNSKGELQAACQALGLSSSGDKKKLLGYLQNPSTAPPARVNRRAAVMALHENRNKKRKGPQQPRPAKKSRPSPPPPRQQQAHRPCYCCENSFPRVHMILREGEWWCKDCNAEEG